jgi:uncharacterized protein
METNKKSTVLITGASSGIGAAMAKNFAAKGYDLFLVARSEEKLNALANTLMTQYDILCIPYPCDLSVSTEVDELLTFLHSGNIPPIEILVNNAGVGINGFFLDKPFAQYEEMIALNITALTRLCHSLLPQMLQTKKGGIINVASTGSFIPVPFWAVYCATKSYVLDFTEALWGEYHTQGVKFLALCPGDTSSNFHTIAGSNQKGLRHDTPETVAQVGIQAFFNGDVTKIVGIDNFIQSNLPRFVTRKATIKLVAAKTGKRLTNR